MCYIKKKLQFDFFELQKLKKKVRLQKSKGKIEYLQRGLMRKEKKKLNLAAKK